MSVSKYMWRKSCDGNYCMGDCDYCEKAFISKEDAIDALEHLMYSSTHEATQSIVTKKHYKEILLRFIEQRGDED